MGIYNLTGIATNSTSLDGFAQAINYNLTFGWLFTFFLIGFFAISYMSFYYKTRDNNSSLIGSTVATFVISILLTAMDLIPDIVMFVCALIAGITVAFSFKK